ncbi:MAG: penicillin-binding protein 2 [Deltaproteobacteria bacterium]
MTSQKNHSLVSKKTLFTKEEQEINKRRCLVAAAFLVAAFVILLIRIGYLQVIKGEDLAAKSERNRLRTVRLIPPRGDIVDRKGRLMVGTRPCFDICLLREEARDIEGLIRELAVLLDVTESDLRASIIQGMKQPSYMPVILKRDVDWETLSRVEARLHNLPGIAVEVVPGRYYPEGPVASHLLGYLGEVTGEDLDAGRYPNAYAGDLVGKNGAELQWNEDLAGRAGRRWVEVDAKGRYMKFLREEPPIRGNDLHLTVDLDLQKAAEEALAGQVGAVVALDPRSGAVRALVSTPGFDPAVLSRGVTKEEWKALNDSLLKPLYNRALQGGFAPGSTFKIVMAAAGLEEKLVDEHSTIYCPGSFWFGNRSYRCWNRNGHGTVTLYKALVESCDVYFYHLGLRLGVDRIARYAHAFGLGAPTGIDLPDEKGGTVASTAWKRERFKEKWYEGETVSIAIGQGYTVVTPIQMARLIAAVGNGGILYRPHVFSRLVDPEGRPVRSSSPEVQGTVGVSKKNLSLVASALQGVVGDPRGTGKACRLPKVAVAGKTGTAQVVKQAKRRQDEKMPWQFRDHAWFVAYAPVEDPQLAVAVLVEHGGHGGSAAAPIARKVFERWFQIQSPAPVPAVERSASRACGCGHA